MVKFPCPNLVWGLSNDFSYVLKKCESDSGLTLVIHYRILVTESQKMPSICVQDEALAALIRRAADKDEGALGTLYDQTNPQVYGLAFRILGDPMIAEEVTLDVYMQVWRQASHFDHSRGKPFVWLTMLTRSRAIDRLRTCQTEWGRREPLETIEAKGSPTGDPEALVVQSEQRQLVEKALSTLGPEQREAIEMAYFGGLSQSEIATRLHEPLGTIKTRIRLGMVKLRNVLAPFEEGLAS